MQDFVAFGVESVVFMLSAFIMRDHGEKRWKRIVIFLGDASTIFKERMGF